MLTNAVAERGGEDADVALQCSHAREDLGRAFRRALTEAKARGEVSPELDVEAAAALLMVQHYGLNVLAKAGATPGELTTAVEALLAGLK